MTSLHYIPLPAGGCVFCRRTGITVATLVGADRYHVCESCAVDALPGAQRVSVVRRIRAAIVERQLAGRAVA